MEKLSSLSDEAESTDSSGGVDVSSKGVGGRGGNFCRMRSKVLMHSCAAVACSPGGNASIISRAETQIECERMRECVSVSEYIVSLVHPRSC